MELQTQPSSPFIYKSTPSSPNSYGRTGSNHFYSAPPSPRQVTDNIDVKESCTNSIFDDFEFKTSKKFDYPRRPKNLERGDSLPAMTFADELFVDGLIMPLKPPPRLQYDSDVNSFSQRSPVSSPRTVCKIPFACRNAWIDEFDPFMLALEKVREEKRSSHQMRLLSYSSFTTISKSYSGDQEFCNGNSAVKKPVDVLRPRYSGQLDFKGSVKQEVCDGNSAVKKADDILRPSYNGPLDFKGLVYARWVREQKKEGGFMQAKSSKGFIFGHKVGPPKTEEDFLEGSLGRKNVEEKGENGNEETKARKLEGRKPSYISRLSFKFKGNGKGSEKKSVPAGDKKMAIVLHKPSSFGLCLGYGRGSPKIKKMKKVM